MTHAVRTRSGRGRLRNVIRTSSPFRLAVIAALPTEFALSPKVDASTFVGMPHPEPLWGVTGIGEMHVLLRTRRAACERLRKEASTASRSRKRAGRIVRRHMSMGPAAKWVCGGRKK